jgi:opacity protein-like surface antigen
MKTIRKNATKGILLACNKLRLFFLAILLLLLFSTIVNGQKRWSAALRTGVNFPTQKLADANLKTGFGLGGNISYRLMQHLHVTGGWDWNRFSADQSFAGAKMDFEETGYNIGFQFNHPIEKSKLNYIIGAGAVYNHIEIENNSGDIIANSGHGWGWQAEAGLSFPITKRVHLIPGVRYRSLSRDFKTGESATAVNLRYMSAGVALSWSF